MTLLISVLLVIGEAFLYPKFSSVALNLLNFSCRVPLMSIYCARGSLVLTSPLSSTLIGDSYSSTSDNMAPTGGLVNIHAPRRSHN